MAFKFNSVLKPENSVISGIAVAGAVWAIYSMNVGPVSQAHASDANHPANESARKKAGYISFIFVSAITLITRDSNVGLLGFSSIIAMDLEYRHAIMAHPGTGAMTPPGNSSYTPAGGNIVDFSNAGANAPATGYVSP